MTRALHLPDDADGICTVLLGYRVQPFGRFGDGLIPGSIAQLSGGFVANERVQKAIRPVYERIDGQPLQTAMGVIRRVGIIRCRIDHLDLAIMDEGFRPTCARTVG